jgi:NAD(P)-dependent dehydrogenase (short-subunit alcohol dehydrogenase family)
MKLEDRVAIITGAGRGIGKCIALEFAREGASLVICDLNVRDANSVANDLRKRGVNCIALKADVSKEREIRKLVDRTLDEFGEIDILVNNAGTASSCPLEEMTEHLWDRVVNVNLKGTFLCSMMVGKIMMRQKKGNIISLASTAGHTAYFQGGAYGVSKTGIMMLMKQIAVEWGKYNIRANSISPGFIRTPMTEHIYMSPESYRKRVELVPIKRIGSAEDIARVALFLASDDSSYITGEDIVVDGGFLPSIFAHVPGRPST